MKRRDFLKSSALAVLASNLNLPAETLQGIAGAHSLADDCTGHLPGTMPTAGEMLQAKRWLATKLAGSPPVRPFSFSYDGKMSDSFLATWPRTVRSRHLDRNRIQRTVVYADPNTGLEVRCIALQYLDFPVVEWTVYLKNTGRKNTPILKDIQGLDIHLERRQGAEYVLHHNRGDFDIPGSYQPYSEELPPNSKEAFSPVGGRPTNSAFPYYNLQMPDGGLIIAVGWPGQWITTFRRDEGSGLHLSAGQELTHLYLEPNEEIRTPLIALLFWQGTDTARAQNLWRRWMLKHILPRPGGKLPSPILSFCDGAFFPGLKVDEGSEKRSVDVLTHEDVKLDYWWLDAGWYPCGDNWSNTGTWEPDPVRFPQGLRAVSDYVHARGTGLIVWFEPERVTAGSWLARNHPAWLLNNPGSDPGHKPTNSLLNLGRADVRAWLIDHIGSLIAQQGIDLYRQDFNIDPLPFWRRNDPPDRQGITENLHIQGYLAYWDALRHRYPKMLIDSCASGGRRIDLETMRRAVPLTRSDYSPFDGDPASTTGNQGHTYGLSSWIPYYGQGAYIRRENTVYYARSYMCPSFAMPVDVRTQKVDWDLYRRLVKDWRLVADCMSGDYYPLTEYSLRDDQWIAWQFNRPEHDDGMIQAFRRDRSETSSMRFGLKGLDPAAQYRITDLDTTMPSVASGRELLENGLVVKIGFKPGAALFAYRKVACNS